MTFTSLLWFPFVALVACALAVARAPARRILVLFASYLFYASWNPFYILLLLGVGALAQQVGVLAIRKEGKARAVRAYGGVAVLVGVLIVFRSATVLTVLDRAWGSPTFGVAFAQGIPLGLSFYTFEAIGYLVEVAKGREQAYGFWDFQLFVAFFPHLVSGPIMRAKDLIGQFREANGLVPRELGRATWLVVSGLFLKLVIADQVAPKLDAWYASPATALSASDVAILAIGFGLQMYLDFCGYSRIAMGSGLFAGARLTDNFNFPFSAQSPADFWNRWHISLSRWIRDYVFLGFVGRSRSLVRLCAAAVVSMVLCGLWHGVGTKFLVWGAFHGMVIAGYHIYRQLLGSRIARVLADAPTLQRIHDFVGWGATLVALLPGWILFRAETSTQAAQLIGAWFSPRRYHGRAVDGNVYLTVVLLFAVVVMAPFVRAAVQRVVEHVERDRSLGWRLAVDIARGGVAAVVLTMTLLYWGTSKVFIYFQF